MEDHNKDPLTDEFVSFLVDYDEALAAGCRSSPASLAGEELDAQFAARLARARDCLQLLERVRRAGTAGDESTLRKPMLPPGMAHPGRPYRRSWADLKSSASWAAADAESCSWHSIPIWSGKLR